MRLAEKKKRLEEKINFINNGGGFGRTDVEMQHQMEIDQLRFEIDRSDKYRIGTISAFIGALFAFGGGLFSGASQVKFLELQSYKN
jgi:hypothetical protein